MSYRRAREPSPEGSSASMTVCTNDVALRNLIENALPVAVSDRRADAEQLLAPVIEFEDERVCLSTIGTSVRTEKFHEVHGTLRGDPLFTASRVLDVASAVRCVMLMTVGGSTRAAIVV